MLHVWRGLVVLLACALLVLAQTPITFQYFYDDLNQLVKVVDSTGVVIQYVYDPVGNIVQINRSTVVSGVLTIFNVTPLTTTTGAMITIQGQGFSPTPSLNQVTIGGAMATVISATGSTLVVMVPLNAVSGPVVVKVGTSTATASTNETIIPLPVITSISPKTALAGTTVASFTVTGANFTGATFAFSQGATAVISNVSIGAGGASATMTVMLSATAKGRFTLMATNSAGSSDPTAKLGFIEGSGAFNTLTVPGSNPNADPDQDGLTNAQEISLGTDPLNQDTDGDGYSDGLEVALGSDPLNAHSIPSVNPAGPFVGNVISMLNTASTVSGPMIHVLTGPTISMLNTASTVSGPTIHVLTGPIISMLNTASTVSGPMIHVLTGPTISMLNTASTVSGPTIHVLTGPIISMLNTASTVSGPMIHVLTGPTISMLNTASTVSGPSPRELDGPLISILNNAPAVLTPSALARFSHAFVQSALRRGRATVGGHPVCQDSDGDGLCDDDEIILGTNPFSADTDGDGYPDGLELALGSDPLNPLSIPNINPRWTPETPAIRILNFSRPVAQARPRALQPRR